MRSHAKIAEFLNSEHVGRIASIDAGGYPQVIPMNFVFLEGVIYMHSHTRGEKLDNIMRNAKVGFEVDRELEFLPSYFEDPADASLADTLYISVVVKGTGSVVSDRGEKTRALNGLMAKYQPEGRYEPVSEDMRVLDAVSVIKVEPSSMRGKYKIGQHLSPDDRMALAEKILARGSQSAERTLEVMGFGIRDGKPEMLDEPVW
ncbi:MAG: pyridoxamine 5'-phosphate oxidase family protein [Nitrosopumilus sp. H8]|nr:MAG: pyridoxamine 5'-phosphate oxidase family protein [Nitrosopumilus sp. H8]